MSTFSFKTACDEYRYLRERDYPEKAALKIVSDRHRLSRQQRNSLFRGIAAPAAAESRRRKIVQLDRVPDHALGIDWYNVLITVESYLHGHAVFTCDDGLVRDSAGTHGSYRVSAVTARALDAIATVLKEARPARVDAYLDAPIAFSGSMAEEVRRVFSASRLTTDVVLVHSADYPLKTYAGIVASSDSTILDAAAVALDLARHVLSDAFGFTPPAVIDLFS